MNDNLINIAKQYSELGFSVIPVKNDKSPALRSWIPFQKKKMTNSEIQSSFSFSSVAGLGIVCGAVSGNLEVIDVDLKYDKSGTLGYEFKQLIRDNLPGIFNKIVVASTRNKGLHLYFRCETIAGNQKLAANSDGEVLIETRGEGGYVIVPPSPGYLFIYNELASIPVITDYEREVLFSIARSFDENDKSENSSSYYYESDVYSPFDDYNARADVSELLKSHGWKKVAEKEDRIYFLRPGKEIKAVSANWHIKKRVFYNFSTSAVFETGKGYSATGLFTVLECNGDFSIASIKLKELGYGYQKTHENKELLRPTPLLPISGFPTEIQNFINTCQKVYQTPRDFWSGSVIASIALAIGDKLELVTKYKNIPVLWSCIVGDVSSGKSEPQRLCLEPFQNLDDQHAKQYNEEKADYERISKLSPTERQEQGYDEVLLKPRLKQYLLNDFTPEAMVEAHEANKHGIMISRDELKGWLDDFGRYNKSGEQSNMVSYWSRIPANTNRKSYVIRLPHPVIHVFGGMQPDLINKLQADDRAEDGFLARICFTYPDSSPKPEFLEEVIPDELKQKWRHFIVELTKLQDKTELFLSDEAKRQYRNWYNKNKDISNGESSGYLKGVYGKLDIIALRMAIIIKGMYMVLEEEKTDTISGDIMHSALEITEYFRATALKVYRKIFNKNEASLSKNEVAVYLYKETVLNKTQIANLLNVYRQQVQRWTLGITKKET